MAGPTAIGHGSFRCWPCGPAGVQRDITPQVAELDRRGRGFEVVAAAPHRDRGTIISMAMRLNIAAEMGEAP